MSVQKTHIERLKGLSSMIEGELYFDHSISHLAMKNVYSTDASVYQETPVAVAIPKSTDDIKHLISFAKETGQTLIPRAAGTSLAGQVVGAGIVIDLSKHFINILEVNTEEKWVRVQPGVIRNDLNAYLRKFGLMFGPETSTASRAMIGGMIGNNSCGLHSIVWGDTRNNLISINAILSDGSEVVFRDLYEDEMNLDDSSLESTIYSRLKHLMHDQDNRESIKNNFPKKEITRRNSGYALDALVEMHESNAPWNLCKLIAGSEGTLCVITEAKLKLIDLPPPEVALVNVHCTSINESLQANLVALASDCYASELIDDIILECTKGNASFDEHRDFVVGDPKAILMVEFFDHDIISLNQQVERFIELLRKKELGYAYPVLYNETSAKAWELRKGALSILWNINGDAKPVNLIEDCAVSPEDLPSYIGELEELLKKNGLQYSMSAHAGAGELHINPLMNLKLEQDRNLFRKILHETTLLVKKYNGSLSGEHGDGRLRGEFLPLAMGQKNYELFTVVKEIFDPFEVFNRGKITKTPPMDQFLRVNNVVSKQVETILDFQHQEGIQQLAEKCSGSGDCRKTQITGGTMCPSYMATRSESDSTRARANMLRHYYSQDVNQLETNDELLEQTHSILDLCLSCKGCKTECPSGVDVGKMKAEFTQHYYERKGVPFRSKLLGRFVKNIEHAYKVPWLYNGMINSGLGRILINRMLGIHPNRSLPSLTTLSLRDWSKHRKSIKSAKKVYLFADEFTNYLDTEIGKKCILLLEALGYEVVIPEHLESARSYLSKGLLYEARQIAIENVSRLSKIISENTPLIGIEPSAILSFRDEYIDLVPQILKADAKNLSVHTLLFEEWFDKEAELGRIKQEQFTNDTKLIRLHGHCHQKALSSMVPAKRALSFPKNYKAQLIPSGCCGMAGSFGYEKEHYDLSMNIGELVLFPTVRSVGDQVIVAANGTSCRHQIKDSTGKIALHPIEVLYDALITL